VARDLKNSPQVDQSGFRSIQLRPSVLFSPLTHARPAFVRAVATPTQDTATIGESESAALRQLPVAMATSAFDAGQTAIAQQRQAASFQTAVVGHWICGKHRA